MLLELSCCVASLCPSPSALEGEAPVAPSARHHHRMAWDRAREVLVMFGGSTDEGWAQGTWEWKEGRWTRADVEGPPAVTSNAVVYDAARGVTLLFGGMREDGSLSGETWFWDGVAWHLDEGEGPSPRHSPAIGYDEVRERVVLFGGSGRGSDALWEWDGAWHPVRTEGETPGPRMRAGFAFDPVREVMLLFGGYLGEVHGDTWAWDGRAWTRLDVEGPPARANHAMLTDRGRARIVLFGGSDSGRVLHGDTWEWDGAAWTRAATDGPSPRTVPACAYDPQSARVLLHGGRAQGRIARADLWSWDGNAWVERMPHPR